MERSQRPRLIIPRILAVSALGFGAGCPAGDDSDTGNESGPSMTTSADGTMSGSTEPADSGSTTEPPFLPDCPAHPDQAECNDAPLCSWQPDYGGCVLDCTLIDDRTTCTGQLHCEWIDDCHYGPLE